MSAAGSPIRMSAAGGKPHVSRRFASAACQPPVEAACQPPIYLNPHGSRRRMGVRCNPSYPNERPQGGPRPSPGRAEARPGQAAAGLPYVPRKEEVRLILLSNFLILMAKRFNNY